MNATLLDSAAPTALRIVLGVTMLWLLAGAGMLLFRRSAAWRHRLWSLATLAAMLLPVLTGVLPEIRLGWVLAASTASRPAADIHVEPHEATPSPMVDMH